MHVGATGSHSGDGRLPARTGRHPTGFARNALQRRLPGTGTHTDNRRAPSMYQMCLNKH